MAIIIITHDLGVVAEIADDIAVMYAGRIVERASTERIFANPQHPYTWGLLRSIPRLDSPRGEELVPIAGRPPSLINPPPGCHFHPRCPYAQASHKRIDPRLEPLPTESAHHVACLLDVGVRKKIWDGLQAGTDPVTLRKLAGSDPLVVDASVDQVPLTAAPDAVAMPSEGDVAGQHGGGV